MQKSGGRIAVRLLWLTRASERTPAFVDFVDSQWSVPRQGPLVEGGGLGYLCGLATAELHCQLAANAGASADW